MAKQEEEKKNTGPKEPWNDGHAAALPARAEYFSAMRTDAFENMNAAQPYVELMVAQQVDAADDKWKVVKYSIYDLDDAPKMEVETITKGDVSFAKAAHELAVYDEWAKDPAVPHLAPFDLQQDAYDPETNDKYAFLGPCFRDIEDYKLASNIEGLAFDKRGIPHRRVEGRVIASGATFTADELNAAVAGKDINADHPAVANKIEGGLLSDIFATSVKAPTDPSLDAILKVGEAFSYMDKFTENIATFYLRVQDSLGVADKLDKVDGLTIEAKDKVYRSAVRGAGTADGALEDARENLARAKQQAGVHTEPFEKFVAECDLYLDLLAATTKLSGLKASFDEIGGVSADKIQDIKMAAERSKEKFMQLGGTEEQVDRLYGWVAKSQKDPVPPWMPGFLTRYYKMRNNTMRRMKIRQKAAANDARTAPAKVKPPVAG